MTQLEIENLLLQLQQQVIANTAAIETLNDTISNYVTTDDFVALTNQINTLQNNNIILRTDLNTLSTAVTKVDHLG